MRKKGILFLAGISTVFILFGCDNLNFLNRPKKTESPAVVRGTVIARVANIPITLEMLNREIDAYNASIDFSNLSKEEKQKAKIESREKKIEYFKNVLLRRMVFYQAALDRGIDRREDIREILERNKATILAQEMENEITKNINVGIAEVDEAYKNVKDQLKEPEVRRIREIAVRNEADAKQALLELLQGADFAALARERSIAESAKTGGDLGFIKKGQRGERYITFDDVAFSPALQQGALSSVFKGPDGYCIIKIEAVKEGKQPTLSEVQDRLKELLLMRKSQEELDRFYSQAVGSHIKVEIYESEIK